MMRDIISVIESCGADRNERRREIYSEKCITHVSLHIASNFQERRSRIKTYIVAI